MMSLLARPLHLVRRFVWSVRTQAPDPAAEAWLLSLLSTEQRALYEAQPLVDRCHAVDSATFVRQHGSSPDDAVAVASALHDVGKAEAGLGTYGRVAATLVGVVLSDDARARWATRSGVRGSVGRYLRHDQRGAELLAAAGSSELCVAWARDHHLEPGASSIGPELFALLLEADNHVAA